mmetsp:Transcript_14099/g.41468  ORF Transcript_14099/g.41468 Transcript_14099/m.41468 type:complete len:237 (+) Transcript_14099:449-1159(+)
MGREVPLPCWFPWGGRGSLRWQWRQVFKQDPSLSPPRVPFHDCRAICRDRHNHAVLHFSSCLVASLDTGLERLTEGHQCVARLCSVLLLQLPLQPLDLRLPISLVSHVLLCEPFLDLLSSLLRLIESILEFCSAVGDRLLEEMLEPRGFEPLLGSEGVFELLFLLEERMIQGLPVRRFKLAPLFPQCKALCRLAPLLCLESLLAPFVLQRCCGLLTCGTPGCSERYCVSSLRLSES